MKIIPGVGVEDVRLKEENILCLERHIMMVENCHP